MSSGANIGDGGPDGIGDNPTDLGAWEKLQLGWLDYALAEAGKPSSHRLGPAEGTTRNGKQGLVVVLPDKPQSLPVVAPKTGDWSYWSGMGDMLDNTMTKPMTLRRRGDDRRRRVARHRGALRLRVPRGLDRQRSQLGADQDEPLAACLGRPGPVQHERHGDGRLSGGAYLPMVTTVSLPTGNVSSASVSDGREHRWQGRRVRQHRGHGLAARRRRDRHRLGLRRLRPDRERRRRDADASTRTSPRTAGTWATTRRSRRRTTSVSSTRGPTGSSPTRTRTGS